MSATLLFPFSFTNDFGPAALLFPQVLYICFVLQACTHWNIPLFKREDVTNSNGDARSPTDYGADVVAS